MKALFPILMCLVFLSGFSQKKESTVIILHINDIHAKIEQFPALKHKVDSIKNIYKDVFLLSAGDLFSGNPFVDCYTEQGYPIIDLMNDVRFDASALGNHEFDYGQVVLNKRVAQAHFPIMAANVVCNNSIYKQPKGHCVLTTKSGLRLGIVSLLQVNENGLPETHPNHVKSIHFTEPLETIKPYKNKLKDTDVQIALTHLGYEDDIRLAKANPWLELVVGGHSHTTLSEPVKIGKVMVTQAGSNGRYLGFTKMKFEGDKLKSIEDQLLSLQHQTEDSLTLIKVEKYTNNPDFQKEIGFLPHTFSNREELGKMVAKAYQTELNVDIAFQNLGGVRINRLDEGTVRKMDLMRLDPFNNEMMTFKMYPSEMIAFLRYAHNMKRREHIVSAGIQIEYVYNKFKELVDIKLTDNNENPLIDKGLYTVAINSYMVTSFDFPAKIKAEHSGFASNNLLINFVSKHFPLRK